jgi:hypothetical protein
VVVEGNVGVALDARLSVPGGLAVSNGEDAGDLQREWPEKWGVKNGGRSAVGFRTGVTRGCPQAASKRHTALYRFERTVQIGMGNGRILVIWMRKSLQNGVMFIESCVQ